MSAVASCPGLLGEHDFIRYLIARCLSTLAVQMQTVAVGWQVYAMTRDPLHLGLIGLSQFLPFVVLILPARARRRFLRSQADHHRLLSAQHGLGPVFAAFPV